MNPTKPVTRINRYDLKARQLVAVIDPVAGEVLTGAQPDSGAGAVQDVAFSPDGKLIYVAIATRDENNTIFRSATSGSVKTSTSNPPGAFATGTAYGDFPSDARLKSI